MKQKGLLRTIVQDMTENASDSVGYFRGIFPLYIHKKLRRLAEAVYLVTNHLASAEPLKNSIREEVTKIVNLSVNIKGDKLSESGSVLYEEIIISLAKVISFLEIAAVSGMIGESNYYLIVKELNILFKSLTDKLKDGSGSGDFLPTSFFEVDITGTDLQGAVFQKEKNIKDKEIIIDSEGFLIKDGNDNIKNLQQPSSRKDSGNDTVNYGNKSKKILRTVEKLDREKMILDFFKDNNKMTIKDISSLLPQYSEKTIQREILRLVAGGVLSKLGKKRWTLYFLNDV